MKPTHLALEVALESSMKAWPICDLKAFVWSNETQLCAQHGA
jgi:hypothetical protein